MGDLYDTYMGVYRDIIVNKLIFYMNPLVNSIFKSGILSILLYCSKSWHQKSTEEKKIEEIM